MRKIASILFHISTAIVSLNMMNEFLDKNIYHLLEVKDLYSINVDYGSVYKDKGIIFNEYVTENEGIVLQGSSEFTSPVSQVATTYFPSKGLGTIVTNGRSYSQHLSQISTIGSQKNSDKERNVAIIVSLQWFMEKNGINTIGYQTNFSPVQFYGLLDNEMISDENKLKYAYRVSKLLNENTQYAPEKLYAEMYIDNGIKNKVINVLFSPYFFVRKYILEVKDKGILYKKLKTLSDKPNESNEKYTVDWNEELKNAESEAKSQTSGNEFNVYDAYYDTYLTNNIDSQKDAYKDVNLMNSKEFEDYELYLDICSELNIRPYIIMAPTNGLWYDHTGLTQEKRSTFYNTIQEMAKKRGFEVLNLEDEEYNPYFICDVMHLGTKGWLKVDEEIYKQYFEKQR